MQHFVHYTISCACLFIYLFLQRMRDITRTQLCTKEVSGHNLYPFEDAESVSLVAFLLKISNFFAVSNFLSYQSQNVERFNTCIFRWLNFLNAPKPTDSLSSCTVGKQRMTWFSSVFTLSSSQSSTFLIVYHSLCVLSKRFSLGITEMVSSSGILSKSLDGQARVCSSSHRGVSQ